MKKSIQTIKKITSLEQTGTTWAVYRRGLRVIDGLTACCSPQPLALGIDMKDIADLTGYNERGEIVYQVKMSLHDYYDGEHPWDDTEETFKLGLTRVNGKIYDSEGTLIQEFETAFSKDTGKYIGSTAVYDDGSTNKDGIYQTQG